MKLVRQTEGDRIYRLRGVEARLFVAVLSQFPCVKPAHQRASMTGEGAAFEEAEALLAAATAERAQQRLAELHQWLRANDRFKSVAKSLELQVERGRIEWLLQILNDVRVGLWVRLGSPQDLEAATHSASAEATTQFMLLDAAGMFQMALLSEGAD